MKTPHRILVLGAGGVGGLVAGQLAMNGVDVSVVTKNPRIAETISKDGLRFATNEMVRRVELPAYDTLPTDKNIIPFDMCIVAVPPNFAGTAVADANPFLEKDAPIVCLCNGLVDFMLAETYGDDRVIGGVVGFGARMLSPGNIVQTGPGEITLGNLSPRGIDALRKTKAALKVPTRETENLPGVRWSKLAINCAISALGTTGGDRLGTLMRSRQCRRLALETMTEVVQVARASGVQLEKVAGTLELNWLALTDADRSSSGSPSLLAKHTVLLAVGSKYRKMRSSMLSAIERGREPSIEFLNGEIVRRGEELGIDTPINRALLECVNEISRGSRAPTMDNIFQIYENTRSLRSVG